MKKVLLSSLTVVLLGLFTVSFAQSHILSGKFSGNSQSSGYTLDKGSGERSYSIEVNFLKPFEARPNVALSVTQIDAEKGANLRYSIDAISVSRDGFTVKILTWGDAKIFGISGYWIAHSE
jgi:hypothetical protein